jgi:hypothetical protein
LKSVLKFFTYFFKRGHHGGGRESDKKKVNNFRNKNIKEINEFILDFLF